jgi:hypothetical protein
MMAIAGETAMSDRQRIEGAAFDPTTLAEIGTAFDVAWAAIEHHFGDTDVDLARSRLAEAILIVASDHEHHEIAELKTEALQVLALAYRCRWPLNWH